jgi:hypothetical protein
MYEGTPAGLLRSASGVPTFATAAEKSIWKNRALCLGAMTRQYSV